MAVRITSTKLGRTAFALILGVGLWLSLWRPRVEGDTAKPSPSVVGSALPANPAQIGASAESTPAAPAAPSAAAQAPPIDRPEVMAFLAKVIDWQKAIDAQMQVSSEPEDTLFAVEEHQIATAVLQQAFAFARAAVPLLLTGPSVGQAAPVPAGAPSATGELNERFSSSVREMLQHRDQLRQLDDELKREIAVLRDRMLGASRRDRASLEREAAAREAQIDLVQARLESLDTLIDFERNAAAGNLEPKGFEDQIDELERSVTPVATNPGTAPASAVPAALPVSLERLLALRQKQQALDSAIVRTDGLAQVVDGVRQKFVHSLAEIDHERIALAPLVGAADLATSRRTTTQLKQLAISSKSLDAALEPLSRQSVLLQLYAGNLARWRKNIVHRWHGELRREIFHAFSLALVFGLVFAASAVWRNLTFRYVEDLQRRQQLLQLRRLALIATLALVLLFGFTSEISTLATVLGLAAAGVALALQNVILSLAGYFYLSGRFGIRVGDRVQISGITGDVIESGFFKLTLLEIGDEDHGRQFTGRAVIFPNSVVFQSSGNFFRQLPGSSLTWNELRLTLAPGCDYRQAEELVTGVVNEALGPDLEILQRECRVAAAKLNMRVETPQPQIRLHLTATGLTMVVRYPARLGAAALTADRVARGLVDAVRRVPGLELLAGIPPVQTAADSVANPQVHPGGSR